MSPTLPPSMAITADTDTTVTNAAAYHLLIFCTSPRIQWANHVLPLATTPIGKSIAVLEQFANENRRMGDDGLEPPTPSV